MKRRDFLHAIGLGTVAVTTPTGLNITLAVNKRPSIRATSSENLVGEVKKTKVIKSRPKLSFRKEPHKDHEFLTFVSANFSDVPGCTCEMWCYESELDFIDFRKLGEGKLELRHRVRNQPHVFIVTTAIPQPGAIELVAGLVLDPHQNSKASLPNQIPGLNMCFQLRKAEGFCSQPDPYPDFVKRCFIFTDKGRTFLHNTNRRKILHR